LIISTIVVNGLIVGVYYAMMALGLTMIFGVLRIVNFAHGEFYMLGGFAYVLLYHSLGVPVLVALPSAILVGVAFGWIVEKLLIRPVYADFGSWRHGRDEYAIIVTFGLGLLLVSLMNKLVGPWSLRGPRLVDGPPLVFAGLRLLPNQIATLLIAIVCLAAVMIFLNYTLWGKQIRAVAQNRVCAAIMGVDVGSVSTIVFAVAGGLAALAGALLSNTISPTPDIGAFPAIKSYVIIVLGGLGSPLGALVGALLLGVVEALGAFYVSAAYRDTYGLALLILFLLVRPNGLFGEVRREV
jgi:branched-chain amino acid transport system permease protein